MEQRLGKTHIAHAEVGNGGAQRGVVHRHANHQPQREQAVDQRFAELGFGRKLVIDVQRLHVQREAGEHHVVRLGDGAAPGVLEHLPDLEFFKVQTCHAWLLFYWVSVLSGAGSISTSIWP